MQTRPIVLFLFIFSGVSAFADVPLTGRIYSNVYMPTRNMGEAELDQSAVGFWLESTPRISPESSAHLSLSGDARNYSKSRRESVSTSGEASTTSLVMDLREGYAIYATNNFDLRVGKQIIPWGKSDYTNPTNYLTADDLTYLNPDREVRRLGAVSTSFSYTPDKGRSPLNLNLVWTPVFPQSKLLIPKATIPSGVTVQGAVQPRIGLKDTELAGRATYTGQGWDFSISGFRGWSHQPEFKEKTRSITGSSITVTVEPCFYKSNAVGGDFSFTTSGFIFRGEGAFHRTANHAALDPVIMPSYTDAVFGVEKKYFEDFRLQLQVLWRGLDKSLPVSTDSITNSIAAANQLIMGYQEKNRTGGTARLAYDNEGSAWKAEIFYVGYQTHDYLYRPEISYQWSGALTTSIGAEQYGGPKDKPLGSLHDYNSVYAEAKYLF